MADLKYWEDYFERQASRGKKLLQSRNTQFGGASEKKIEESALNYISTPQKTVNMVKARIKTIKKGTADKKRKYKAPQRKKKRINKTKKQNKRKTKKKPKKIQKSKLKTKQNKKQKRKIVKRRKKSPQGETIFS